MYCPMEKCRLHNEERPDHVDAPGTPYRGTERRLLAGSGLLGLARILFSLWCALGFSLSSFVWKDNGAREALQEVRNCSAFIPVAAGISNNIRHHERVDLSSFT